MILKKMSRFGDLIRGKSAPAPVVEEAPAPAPVAKKKKKDRREEVEKEWKEATNS